MFKVDVRITGCIWKLKKSYIDIPIWFWQQYSIIESHNNLYKSCERTKNLNSHSKKLFDGIELSHLNQKDGGKG